LNEINPNPSDYDKAQQLLVAHKIFRRKAHTLNFTL
jgi:hypothetical protein